MILLSLALLGCAPALDPTLALCPEMPSVVEVSWTRSSDAPVWVEYGEGARWTVAGPAGQAGERVRVLVAGAPPGEPLGLQAYEGELRSAPLEITTGALLNAPEGLHVESAAEDDGRWLLTTAMGGFGEFGAGVVVFDRAGRVVWYHDLPEGRLAISTLPALSGEGFWVLSQRMDTTTTDLPEGRLMRIGLDGVVAVDYLLPRAHHAIAQAWEGAVFVNERTVEQDQDGQEFYGQRVIEVDPTGEAKELLDLREALRIDVAPAQDEPPHGNGLNYDPAQGALLWSVLGYEAVVALDAESGALRWSISALDVDMAWPSGVDLPVMHAPSLGLDGALIVFDNGSTGGTAQVRAFDVDPERDEVRDSWSYPRAEGQAVTAMGDAQELSDGHLLISWGTRGELEELDAEHRPIWQASAPLGEAMGNVARLDSLGPAAL